MVSRTTPSRRVPILGTAGLSKVINGPIPYAPDGNPLIGPMPGVPNAFEACVFTFGIAQAGGAGKVLAEWVTEGQTEWDMWSCDPRRFTAFAADARLCRRQGHGDLRPRIRDPVSRAMPGRPAATGSCRRSTTASRRSAPQFNAYNGWERATWYAQAGRRRLGRRRPRPSAATARGRSASARSAWPCATPPASSTCPASRASACKATARATGCRRMITGVVPKPGRIGLGYFADDKGRIVTEMSIMALDEDFFFLITAAVAEVARLRVAAEASAARHGNDSGKRHRALHLPDPVRAEFARKILAEVTDADLSLPWLSHQSCQIAGRWLQLVRVSFAGELGWEIHTKVEDTAAVFDAVWAAGQKHGLKPFGMFALDSLRLEKGYRAWKRRSVDRLHHPAGRARALRQMGQAGFHAARRRCRTRSSRA